jgi:hypothetical protein
MGGCKSRFKDCLQQSKIQQQRGTSWCIILSSIHSSCLRWRSILYWADCCWSVVDYDKVPWLFVIIGWMVTILTIVPKITIIIIITIITIMTQMYGIR